VPDLDAAIANGKTLRSLVDDAIKSGSADKKANRKTKPQPNVSSMLDGYLTKNGDLVVRPTRRNIHLILTHDTRVKGKIWEDQFKGVMMRGDKEYKDTDDTKIQMWIDSVYGMRVSTTAVAEVARLVGEENGVNPLVDWLNGLQWDGVKRLDYWLVKGVGADDVSLNRDMGRRWMISAVARAIKPGCKADCCLILFGPQGARKSTTFRVLAGDEYFCDTPMDIGSPNAYSQIRRAWIYEIAELDSIRKRANSRTKAFLSAGFDNYRPAYGRHSVTIKRHCVFCGTTNEESFISDNTGSRRFWPVKIGKVDLDWVSSNRDQLWAEAVNAFNNNEPWWLDNKNEIDLKSVSEDFREVDPWQPILEKWLLGRRDLMVSEILADGLGLDSNQMTKFAQMRVSDVLRNLGWKRRRTTMMGKRAYVWGPTEVLSFPGKSRSDDDEF
tara:strand:- start:7614 stop:8933 length:1320 start_codon:yes stop_codon:yes gene_type:complete